MEQAPDIEGLTIEVSRNGWVVHSDRTGPALVDALDRLAAAVSRGGGGRIELWIDGADDRSDAAPRQAGFTPYRDLLQMRCRLPASPTDLAVRSFDEADADAFLRVNNRAFHWHPEQGGMTMAGLRARQTEPWYDPDGFLLHEIDGELAGFCWTKIHRNTDPPLGEIYAIAVDPSFHGRGLGRPLTLAGLAWLHRQGLADGLLYVESDNHAAVHVYETIGFWVHQVNRAYERTVDP